MAWVGCKSVVVLSPAPSSRAEVETPMRIAWVHKEYRRTIQEGSEMGWGPS